MFYLIGIDIIYIMKDVNIVVIEYVREGGVDCSYVFCNSDSLVFYVFYIILNVYFF